MSLLIELQYFPPVKVYSTLIKNTNIYFSLYENYQRRSFRNRCILSGANGLISLSIPIAGGRNQRKVFSDVRIDNKTDWQLQHWRTVFSAYGNSPWFFHYAESLEKLYSQKVDLLMDWNQLCLDWVNQSIGVEIKLLESGGTFGKWEDFWKVGGLLESGGQDENSDPKTGLRNEGIKPESALMDWRNRFLPANFQDPALGPFPVYTQVFEDRYGFQPNLSILDFVLCCGKGQTDNLLI
jgi:hypothetical protein